MDIMNKVVILYLTLLLIRIIIAFITSNRKIFLICDILDLTLSVKALYVSHEISAAYTVIFICTIFNAVKILIQDINGLREDDEE